jgi:hypothetical protein
MSDFTDTLVDGLKAIAPTIATALYGPLAGAATAWVAGKLGVKESSVTAVTDAIQGLDPLKRVELENEFQKWYLEYQQKELVLLLSDTQNARARDTVFRANNQRNYRADTMYILAVGVIGAVFYAIWKSPELSEFVKGISTLVLGRFLGYLDGIYNFEFGTTKSSRTKDDTIAKLTGKS